mgnify:CR=1 FL=1
MLSALRADLSAFGGPKGKPADDERHRQKQRVYWPRLGTSMPRTHVTGLFDVTNIFYQGICSCGWLSTVSIFEEVDLLRALHAHEKAVFGEPETANSERD